MPKLAQLYVMARAEVGGPAVADGKPSVVAYHVTIGLPNTPQRTTIEVTAEQFREMPPGTPVEHQLLITPKEPRP